MAHETLSPVKPVSYIWRSLLEKNPIPLDGVVVEVAPGYEKKIGDALAMIGFKGTVILIEPDALAAQHTKALYERILPKATIRSVTKLLQDVRIGTDLPPRVDALLANHPFDDMAIALAMQGKDPTFFTQEHGDGTGLSERIRQVYDSISDRDYVHSILATLVIWKDFIRELKPTLFIASQYPSRKLTLKKLSKRQNSGFIIVELLRDYYDSYLRDQYQERSFGQKGDPAWWIIAMMPYIDLGTDLTAQPSAVQRLGERVFVRQHTRRLEPEEYEVVYADREYFERMGYSGDAHAHASRFAVVLADSASADVSINTYADRQQDMTNIGLSGNQGSGRAVYYGKKFNVMGVGKTTLCTSATPSHSTGKMELIGSLRRLILSRWIGHFTKSVVEHPVVIALKAQEEFKWNPYPVPLSLLVRADDGALDRPSHVEFDPTINIDFDTVVAAYAKLDAQFFAYRFMLGAWSTGNYSLDGRMIDLETVSFVPYRGPYNTTSTKYYHNYFGYEGFGFLNVLEQLATVKKISAAGLSEKFSILRRTHLSCLLLELLGIEEVYIEQLMARQGEVVLSLTNQFESLSKKISPKRVSMNLYDEISDDDDPALVDMSALFRRLSKLLHTPARILKAMSILKRKKAFASARAHIHYEPQLTSKGEVNQGEYFIRDHAVVDREGLPAFTMDAEAFVLQLFSFLDSIDAQGMLPPKDYWCDRLIAANQNFPTMSELNGKLRYWVEEYRSGKIDAETLEVEIDQLCQLPRYPTGREFRYAEVPLFRYLRPSKARLRTIAKLLTTVDVEQGKEVMTQGQNADALYILVQGTCRVVVDGRVINKISNRGAILGEASVLEAGHKRTATVATETPARLLRITRDNLQELSSMYPRMENIIRSILLQRTTGVFDRVRGLGIFREINPEEVRLFLADKAVPVAFTSGESIIQQGQQTAGVFLLVRGSVTLRQDIADMRVSPLELYDKPLERGLFGERSIITGQGAVCSVIANNEVSMLFIRKRDFSQLLHEHPQLLRNCLENMSDYIESDDERGSLASQLAERLSGDRA